MKPIQYFCIQPPLKCYHWYTWTRNFHLLNVNILQKLDIYQLKFLWSRNFYADLHDVENLNLLAFLISKISAIP